MKDLNYYTIETHKTKDNKPLHFVYIKHVMLHGVQVFNNFEQVQKYINDKKQELNKYSILKYDYNKNIPYNIIKAFIKEIENNNKKIVDNITKL